MFCQNVQNVQNVTSVIMVINKGILHLQFCIKCSSHNFGSIDNLQQFIKQKMSKQAILMLIRSPDTKRSIFATSL